MPNYYQEYLKTIVSFVKPTYSLVNTLGDTADIQAELTKLYKKSNPEDRLLIIYYNHLWEPILKLATWLGWRRETGEQNWLDESDISNLCSLADWEVITTQKRMLLPVDIPLLSYVLNNWLANLPIINELCLITWAVARPKVRLLRQYTVSVIVPAKNEKGNIEHILNGIPKFGRWQEVIFVEGHSTDNTWDTISNLKSQVPHVRIKAYKQSGTGKADAVRMGFSRAKGEILMILDADLTVHPQELIKFYQVLASGQGEFVNGSRLVYPMEKEAMRTLNKLGNKMFSWLFTWILGQRFKDTLCGTKCLFKSDYLQIAKNRKFFGNLDPFGDFDLIFGAVKQNLKVVEIPVRYRERTYGATNISRFKHFWLLLLMTWFAFKKFKTW